MISMTVLSYDYFRKWIARTISYRGVKHSTASTAQHSTAQRSAMANISAGSAASTVRSVLGVQVIVRQLPERIGGNG